MIYLAFFIGPIIRWLFADIGLHGTYVVIISIFISVMVGKYLKGRSNPSKSLQSRKNIENNEIVGNIDNTKNESMENKEEHTRTESRRDIKHREREERRQHRRERRNRW